VTDQTKKREDGKKRINRAAVKAPTGSVDEERKEGWGCIRIQSVAYLAFPDTGKEISRERLEKKGSRNRKREKEK